MRTWIGALPLAAALFILPPSVAPSEVQAAGESGESGESEEKTYDYGARVSIEVRMENGKTVKHRGELRSFGNEWRFEFDGEDHHHVVLLNVEGEEGKKSLDVTLSYDRDGMAVIAPYTDQYTARKRQTLWTDDGKLAIALTFTPKKFEREDKSRDKKDKIAPDDDDDPLGGNPLG